MSDTGHDFESSAPQGFYAHDLNQGKPPGQGKKRLGKRLAGPSAESPPGGGKERELSTPPLPDQDQPEELLVERAEHGDESAFSVLVERYWEPIRRHIYYSIGDGAIAEDLTQETFLKAWQGLSMHNQKRDMNFRPWLYRVAHNTMVDDLRRTRKLAALLAESKQGEKFEQASWIENVEDSLCKRESIIAALQKVYPQYCQCLIQRYIYDRDFEEIAHSLGISEVAVRSNISRGRKQFIEAYLQEVRKSNSDDTNTGEEEEQQ